LLELVFDDGSFFELKPGYAPNIVIGFARLGGYCVGVVANQPIHLAGVIDSRAARKAARFVRFCDSFNIPIITFVDVPGFMPGSSEESEGIIHHGAKLIFAYSEATVPKLSVIVRKAYGGAYIVMSSKHLRGDLNFAYPGAEIAVMGPEAAVSIVFKKEIDSAEDKDKKRAELIQQYREKFASPYQSAELGYIDEVISPEQTRVRLFQGLEMLLDKVDRNPKKKHPNPPL
jgi:propionyl-CoA carboxylase beta chain